MKKLSLLLALLLCVGMAMPMAAATGYSSETNYYQNTYNYYPPYNYGYTSPWGQGYTGPGSWYNNYGYGRDWGYDRDYRRNRIPNNRVPLASDPFDGVFDDYTSRATSSMFKKNNDGTYAPVTNVATVSPEALKSVSGTVLFDYTVKGKVLGRVYVDADSLKNTINVALTSNTKTTKRVTNLFEKYNKKGNFAVVTMGQQGSFGCTVRVAVSISQLGKVNTNNMAVLVYNRSTNTYSRLKSNQIIVKGGYVYLSLSKGGDLVFTDAPKYT